MEKDEARERETRAASAAAVEPEMSPYERAKLAEHAEEGRSGPGWSPSRVARLATEDLVGRLRRFGIDGSPEGFARAAEGRSSAWSIGADLWEPRARSMGAEEADLFCLAACELWRRYRPEQPSEEMIVDWTEEGYQAREEDDVAVACERWLSIWEWLRGRLTPEMRRLADAEALFTGEAMPIWVEDVASDLHLAALEGERPPADGVRFCEEVLARFPDEDAEVKDELRVHLAQLLCLAGDRARGEGMLQELIGRRPDEAIGYVRLAEALLVDEAEGARERALELLEQALARPVADAEEWELERRLRDLRRAGGPLREELAALGDDELRARLVALGVDASPEGFRALAAHHASAWELGEELAGERPRSERDLVCQAACELWRRLLPDRPSEEMLLDWLEEGYQEMEEDDPAAACEAWLPLVHALLDALPTELHTLEAIDEHLGWPVSCFEWLTDLGELLGMAALEEPRHAEAGIALFEQLAEQLTEEDPELVDELRCDLADLLCFSGDRSRGEAIFEELIARRPDEGIGYLRLADALALTEPGEAELARAAGLLERARSLPGVHRDDVEPRLAQLRKLMQQS